jgi:hypothetical protein
VFASAFFYISDFYSMPAVGQERFFFCVYFHAFFTEATVLEDESLKPGYARAAGPVGHSIPVNTSRKACPDYKRQFIPVKPGCTGSELKLIRQADNPLTGSALRFGIPLRLG